MRRSQSRVDAYAESAYASVGWRTYEQVAKTDVCTPTVPPSCPCHDTSPAVYGQLSIYVVTYLHRRFV